MEELLKKILEGQNKLVERLDNLEKGQTEIKQSLAKIEQEQGAKISALFDAREVQFDVNERISNSLFRIENKLDRLVFKVDYHDIQLKQVK